MRLALALSACLLASPALAQNPAQDDDGDHVPDDADLCPDVRERDGTAFAGDGCPDTDGDHDGVVDAYDVCPARSETRNGFLDLDGCPDAPGEVVVPSGATHIGCFDGASLLDVTCNANHEARLAPRADAPLWLGTAPLDCYAGVAFDGRRAVHCATPDGAVEATLAMRLDGTHAIGAVLVRSSHGRDVRSWSGTAVPAFDRVRAMDTVLAQRDALQACGQGAVGRIAVAFTIESTGEIDGVHVASDTQSPPRPQVGECLVGIIDAVVLPRGPRCGTVTMTIPFVFDLEP